MRIRYIFFPLWLSIYSKKVKHFTQKTWKKVQYKGEVFHILIDPENGFIDNVQKVHYL